MSPRMAPEDIIFEGNKGIMLDMNDFSTLEFDMPESLSMDVQITNEQVPNQLRNGTLSYWQHTGMRLDLELFFRRKVNAQVDILPQIQWLLDRSTPKYMAGLIVQPLPQFMLELGGYVPRGSIWDWDYGFNLRTEGIFMGLENGLTPFVRVRLPLVRADGQVGLMGGL